MIMTVILNAISGGTGAPASSRLCLTGVPWRPSAPTDTLSRLEVGAPAAPPLWGVVPGHALDLLPDLTQY
jgi:hypothetical protein